ncbi:hypothetical protein J4434_02470 [Candidatus Woesearchaeota archaeon]|nr:hypothetical protein [Candidatus Woesearchaeota archaeon]
MQTLDELIKHVKRYYAEGTWEGFVKSRPPIVNANPEKLAKEFVEEGLSRRTRLFREYIESTFNRFVLPKISDAYDARILSMPCANGEEAFTLAIIALEAGLRYFKIDGRDISEEHINQALRGETWLQKRRIEQLADYIEKGYFTSTNAKFPYPNFFVDQSVKNKCEFYVHDILSDEILGGYEVTYCLNLLIHLSETGRDIALWNLTKNMRQGDLLILDEPYEIPAAFDGRMYGQVYEQFGWKKAFNDFLANLEAKEDLKLRKIGEDNVYEKMV